MSRPADLAALQQHVDERLDAQDKKLDDLLAAFRASRWAVRAIAYLAGLGASLAIIWANWHTK
jgi:hypothetical protein